MVKMKRNGQETNRTRAGEGQRLRQGGRSRKKPRLLALPRKNEKEKRTDESDKRIANVSEKRIGIPKTPRRTGGRTPSRVRVMANKRKRKRRSQRV
jgi:hypothetical protein